MGVGNWSLGVDEMARRIVPLGIVVVVGMLSIVRGQSPQVEWAHYANDAGGTRYSQLTDIDTAKLPKLEQVDTMDGAARRAAELAAS